MSHWLLITIRRVAPVALLLPALLLPVGAQGTEGQRPAELGYDRVLQTESASLWLEPESGAICFDSRGKLWYSNPEIPEGVSLSGFNSARLRSQLVAVVYNQNDQEILFDSASYAADRQGIEVTRADDFVRLEYRFSNFERGEESIPYVVAEDRFEELFLDRVTPEQESLLLSRFRYDPEHQVYRRFSIPDFQVEEFLHILDAVGYGQDDLERDNRENAELIQRFDERQRLYDLGLEMISSDAKERIAFTISLEYRLDDGDLLVTLPAGEISHAEEYPIHALRLLEFFGAVPEQRPGYLLIPDGSGALIDTGKAKPGSGAYTAPVYGSDVVVSRREELQFTYPVTLPVFGLARDPGEADGGAIFAVIEQGEAIANVEADVAGRVSPFNRVNASFRTMERGRAEIGQEGRRSGKLVFPERIYQGELRVRFHSLHGAESSYNGMASYYRGYLQKRQMLPLEEIAYPPLLLDVVGGIRKYRSFMGLRFPYVYPMTRFQEVVSMLDTLASGGTQPDVIRLRGWYGDGLDDKNISGLRAQHDLGGDQQLRETVAKAQMHQTALVLDSDISHFRPSALAAGVNRSAARMLDQKAIRHYSYNPATNQRDPELPSWYIRSPHYVEERLSTVSESLGRYDSVGLGLSAVPDLLQSDYRDGRQVTRQFALDNTEALLSGFAPTTIDHTAPSLSRYATYLVDVPFESSGFGTFTQDIPFLGLVYNGLKPFVGRAVNLSGSPEEELLKAIENGAGLQFTVTGDSASVFRATEHEQYVSTQFELWAHRITTMGRQLRDLYSQVKDPVVIRHERISESLVVITYRSGERVVLNYGYTTEEVEGMRIPGRSYGLVKGARQ